MKNRIKELRESLGKSQGELAKDLGLSRNYISLVENGNRNLSEQSQKVLCSLYNVNEEWLKSGTGEMFCQIDKNDEISKLFGEVIKEDDGDFKRRLVNALAKLDDDGWNALETLIDSISRN